MAPGAGFVTQAGPCRGRCDAPGSGSPNGVGAGHLQPSSRCGAGMAAFPSQGAPGYWPPSGLHCSSGGTEVGGLRLVSPTPA